MSVRLDLAHGYAPVSLHELDASDAFLVRTDHKHVVDLPTLEILLARLAPTHRILDIDGRREFTYDTIYFDTRSLLAARAHAQGRRRRFKARSRLYVETDVCAFELKLISGRGETVKRRIAYGPADHGAVTADARAFLAEHLDDVGDLAPALRVRYTRMTLAADDERVTLDVDLTYGAARLRPGWAIVETKSSRGAGVADRVLRELRSRPVALSKYVLGAGLMLMPAVPNDARRIARRYFEHA